MAGRNGASNATRPYPQQPTGRCAMAPDFIPESEEIWKEAVGLPGYEISNYGRLRSYRFRDGIRPNQYKLLMPKKMRKARKTYVIYGVSVNCRTKYRLAHRLALEAFVGPCPKGMEGCHNDGNPLNNFIGNLRWDTHSENMKDATRHGFVRPFGIIYGIKRRKVDDLDVIHIRLLSSVVPPKQLADLYGVSRSLIAAILRGEKRKNPITPSP